MSIIFDMEAVVAFREKQAWISLVVTLGVYGVYFFYYGQALSQGRSFGVGGPITLAVVAIVVLQIVLNIIAALLSPNERGAPVDERERAIQQRANAGAFYVLQIAVMCAIVTVYFASSWSVANAALAALVAGQIAQYALVIVGYRRAL
jgi:hypothetical protein